MSKGSFSAARSEEEFADTALGCWADDTASPLFGTQSSSCHRWSSLHHKSSSSSGIIDIIFTHFGNTARAVRDFFVTCSSSSSSQAHSTHTHTTEEDVVVTDTTTNTTTEEDVVEEEDELTPSTCTSNHKPTGVQQQLHHPSACHLHDDDEFVLLHRKQTHARLRSKPSSHSAAANSERNLWASGGGEAASAPNCGPKLPSNFFELPTKQRLHAVKQFLAGFTYKPNSETSLQANKHRPLCRLMATARRIVYKPEPIKPVEAVFLALYLTAGLLSVDRIPVSFKTKYVDELTKSGQVSYHTVLLVQCKGKYGAFGISSNPRLMTKKFRFDSMSSVIENYVKEYEASAHTILKLRIGLPVEHDVLSSHFISWRHLCISLDTKPWAECVVEIENHALRMRRLWDLWMLTGKGGDPRKKAGMAKRKVDTANHTPREKRSLQLEKPKVVAATEVVKKKPERRRSRAPAPALPWDAESTGSNTDEEQCEHCEQLKTAMPPSDTKRATLTTVKRMKTSGDTNFFTPKNQILPRHHSPGWEAESFESITGDFKPSVHFKPKLNLMSPKQIVKHFVSSSVLSTPPRRLTNRRKPTRDTDTKQHDERARRTNLGPLYNFAFSGSRSKAG